MRSLALLAVAPAVLAACAPPQGCDLDALSTCAAPAQSADVYADQGQRYFDSLDESSDPERRPDYAVRVVRYEWAPWLLLTGYGADMITAVDAAVLAVQPGTTVPERDCRGFDTQPFGRCHVSFDFDGKPCPIYEEFTFDAAGRITFVEAWSDLPGLLPMDAAADPWAEGPDVTRLSTRVPGLGSPAGLFEPHGAATDAAAAEDPLLADLVARTDDFWGAWAEAYAAAGSDPYTEGCGW